jgi:HSP20 family protein
MLPPLELSLRELPIENGPWYISHHSKYPLLRPQFLSLAEAAAVVAGYRGHKPVTYWLNLICSENKPVIAAQFEFQLQSVKILSVWKTQQLLNDFRRENPVSEAKLVIQQALEGKLPTEAAAFHIIAKGAMAVFKADAPEIDPQHIDVQVENGTLTLKGERTLEKDDRVKGYHRIERSYGAFARSFTLPNTVDSEGVRADYAQGVLTITLSKKELAKARAIKVSLT